MGLSILNFLIIYEKIIYKKMEEKITILSSKTGAKL
jgi:hypothetical protein